MSEDWKDVVGYEGLYKVSSKGQVKSLDRTITRTVKGTTSNYSREGALMAQNKKGSEYMRVCLCKDSRAEKHYVHRLVAEAFIDNPNNLPCVNHLDANKMNNQKDNLKWCTYAENNQHAKDLGLHNVSGENCHLSKLTEEDVLGICDKRDNQGVSYRQLADYYDITPENVSSIVRGKTWKSVTGRGLTDA